MINDITMVSCQHFQSGIGHYGYELGKKMKEKVQALALYKPYKANHSDIHFHNNDWIKQIHYKSFKNLHPYILPLFIKESIRKTKSDIYHAHWFLSGLALSYKLKQRFVVTMHDVSLLHIIEKESRYQKYYKWALERFAKKRIPIITVSETAKRDAIKFANYPEELVFAIPNGINFNKFYPKKQDNLLLNTLTKVTENLSSPTAHRNKLFRIIYSGGLGKRKNVDLLLNAFKKLEKKYDVELHIAGAYPERTIYPSIAKELNLKKVIFTGYIPDAEMNNFYNQGDLLIFPSEYEGFGFAPLEAMATKTPVLSAKGGALKEISGGGAELFDYDIDDLVSKTSYLIENENKRNQLAEKGFRWVQRYNWEKCVKNTIQVYKSVA